jgi:hypothetical protein
MDVCLPLVNVLYCQIEVSGSGSSFVQRSPTEGGVSSECDREAPKREAMTQNRVEAQNKKKYCYFLHIGAFSLDVICGYEIKNHAWSGLTL